jgi:putative ATP-dependent endonuclease of the OLD family
MRLVKVKIQNFRSYKEETIIDLDDLTVFIGKNDSGKSSILEALNIYFNGVPDNEDPSVYCSDKEIKISCVFDDLPKSLVVDEQRETSLKAEYLLNKDGNLEISKIYNCNVSGKVKAPSIFAIAIHPTASKYDDLLLLTNAKLKARAKELSVNLSNVNETVNTELRQAIWGESPDLKLQETKIELKTETAGKIWDQLKQYLPVYALFKSDRPSTDQDEEAQDPMKLAVKEAIKAQEKTLNQITEQINDQVKKIADLTIKKIKEMDPLLANELNPQIINKNWDSLFSIHLTSDDQIPINKRGSGVRRLILLNFFRAQAEQAALSDHSGIIYAVEEPETSQHPNNQKMLIEVFNSLSQLVDRQVFITTHNPLLIRKLNGASLRYVKKNDDHTEVNKVIRDDMKEEIISSLGIIPDHSIKAFFGVEGRHDPVFLKKISKILCNAGEDVPDLEQAENDGFLVFLPMGGSNLDLWTSRINGLNRPCFYLFDRDNEPPLPPKYEKHAEEFRKQSNTTVWITGKREIENYLHPDAIRKINPDYKGTVNDFDDIPKLYAESEHKKNPSAKPWPEVLSDQELLKKKESAAKRRLNNEVVDHMTPELLTAIDSKNEIRTWLKEIARIMQQHQ